MRRIIWIAIVAVFLVVGVAAPVKILNKHIGSSSTYSAAAVGGAGTAGGGGGGTPAVVHMAGLAFAPSHLVVLRATTVVFDNNDVAPHTVTEDSAGGVDSGTLSPGKKFQLVVDRRLVYHCDIHPFMKATVELAG